MVATPRIFVPQDDIKIDHPRGNEYKKYIRGIRFPKPFWEWLEEKKIQENKNCSMIGVRLQKMMDEPYCVDPLHIRNKKRKNK